MKQLKLRFSRPEDRPKIVEWLKANPDNGFDPDILNYPTLQILCAYSDDGPVAFLPVQTAIVLESTARMQGISDVDSAQALRDFTKCAELLASAHGIRELYFLAKDPKLIEMAKNHGYEEMPWTPMRMKLQ